MSTAQFFLKLQNDKVLESNNVHTVTLLKAGLELRTIHLPLPPEHIDYNYERSCQPFKTFRGTKDVTHGIFKNIRLYLKLYIIHAAQLQLIFKDLFY